MSVDDEKRNTLLRGQNTDVKVDSTLTLESLMGPVDVRDDTPRCARTAGLFHSASTLVLPQLIVSEV